MPLWTEKYRPQKFEDVIALPKQIPNLIKNPTHVLMIGVAGIGKTTCARIICKQLDADMLELNASDDRGIQVIRDEVKFFTQKMSEKRKVVFLDEADGLTNDSQQALRRIMEVSARSTLFILTANFLRKIIVPLRSRCSVIEFPLPDVEEIVNRLKHICDEENIKYDDGSLIKITKITYPDIRKAINTLQSSVVDGQIDVEDLGETLDVLDGLFDIIKQRDYDSLRSLLAKYVFDYESIYRYLFDKIFESEVKDGVKKKAMIEIAERMWRNQSVADQEINFMACVFNIEHVFDEF